MESCDKISVYIHCLREAVWREKEREQGSQASSLDLDKADTPQNTQCITPLFPKEHAFFKHVFISNISA